MLLNDARLHRSPMRCTQRRSSQRPSAVPRANACCAISKNSTRGSMRGCDVKGNADGSAVSLFAGCLLNGVYNNAGDTITFSGAPGPYLDPLTPDAVTAFYQQGPQATVLVRPQWTGQPAVPAVTFWMAV